MAQKRIGQQIKELRIRRYIKQSELANHLSVTTSAISHWETGRRMPSIEELKRIARFFNVSLSYFDIDTANSDHRTDPKEVSRNRTVSYLEQPVVSRRILVLSFALSVALVLISIVLADDLGLFTGLASIILAAIVLERTIASRHRTIDRGKHRTVSIPMDHAIFYLHADDDAYIVKRIVFFKRLVTATLIVSIIAYILFANAMRILESDLLDIVIATSAIAATILTAYRYKNHMHGHIVQKRVEYYRSRKSFRGLPMLYSLYVDLLFFYILSTLIFIERIALEGHVFMYISWVFLAVNLLLSFYYYLSIQSFISRYKLFEFDPRGDRTELN